MQYEISTPVNSDINTSQKKVQCSLAFSIKRSLLITQQSSITFRIGSKHRLMLEQLHKVVSTHQIRIDPIKFPKVVPALRTATNKPNAPSIWELDKAQSSSNDVLDALRLSLLCLRGSNTNI